MIKKKVLSIGCAVVLAFSYLGTRVFANYGTGSNNSAEVEMTVDYNGNTVYEYTDAATGTVTQCAFGGGIFNTSWQDILSGLGWGLGYFGMPHILVRFMSIEKPSMIKKSSIVAIVWVIISLFSAVMIAYFGRMLMGAELLTQGNQKLVFIAMARRFFPAGICGLLLAAIIAASISTADSQLLVSSSSFTADLY